MTLSDNNSVADLWEFIPDNDKKFLNALSNDKRFLWTPLKGPQTMAYNSQADIVGYGGAAGGGKTDLLVGKALTQHKKTMILRREATQLPAIIDRFTTILGGRDGYNGTDKIWRLDDKQIEFGSVPHLGDELKYQGRPHDLIGFDEAANFLEEQVRFLLGWLRTVDPKQKCQALLAFNPPTQPEGRWIIEFFSPWLDKKHPHPAKPGELRYFATIAKGLETEVDSPKPFIIKNGEYVYNFKKLKNINEADIIRPLSRTFIPSRIADNPYLLNTGYMHMLQALPEPLRSQMLYGDFHAGMQDSPWQIIPTKWVEDAMRRWKDLDVKPPMNSLGIDVARGGKDKTVIFRRHDKWFDRPLAYTGEETPDGPKVAGLVIMVARNRAVMHIEINGVGASPYDFLIQADQPVIGVDVSMATNDTDKSGRLRFFNVRSALWWKMREALDPTNNKGIALPPSKRLLLDLTGILWELKGNKIKAESRNDIIKRTGKSPDYGTALMLALLDTPKLEELRNPMMDRPRNATGVHNSNLDGYNPYKNL